MNVLALDCIFWTKKSLQEALALFLRALRIVLAAQSFKLFAGMVIAKMIDLFPKFIRPFALTADGVDRELILEFDELHFKLLSACRFVLSNRTLSRAFLFLQAQTCSVSCT
jgi:hypothetical protein